MIEIQHENKLTLFAQRINKVSISPFSKLKIELENVDMTDLLEQIKKKYGNVDIVDKLDLK